MAYFNILIIRIFRYIILYNYLQTGSDSVILKHCFKYFQRLPLVACVMERCVQFVYCECDFLIS